MRVFISWSGELSRLVALALRDWLGLLMSGIHVFVSDIDIEKGTRGLVEIAEQLESAEVGIVCVTRENLERPWVNFEAGAISTKVGQGRLIPFLIDLDNTDVPRHSPLTQFQTTTNERNELREMIRSINRVSGQKIDDGKLDTLFERLWDDLDTPLRAALAQSEENAGEVARKISLGEMTAEMLELARGHQRE